MPYYEVNHTISLLPSQKSDLARAITEIHSTRFSTPRLFVNVKFTDFSETPLFIGGHEQKKSHILAHVRTGASRTTKDFNTLCADVTAAWNDIVVPLPKVRRSDSDTDEDRKLYSVFVLGDIVAGMEAGFEIPEAGKDKAWLAENMGAFRARAESGEEEFAALVKEVEERGLIKEEKTEAQKLEEMMGWGDSA